MNSISDKAKKRVKLVRTSTVPTSINTFCRGLLKELQEEGEYEIEVISSPGESLAIIKEREEVKVHEVAMERRIAPLKDLKSLWKMVKTLRKIRPDMIHSISPKAGLLSMIAGWICRVPVRLHTFTGLIFPTSTGLKRRLLMFTDKITCGCATHIVPEGEGVKDDLQKAGITKKPLEVLGYGNIRGIDMEYYSPEKVASEAGRLRKEGKFTFIYVGRCVRDKGVEELVDAFVRINERYPDVRLVMVGRTEQDLDPVAETTIRTIHEHPGIEAVGQKEDVRPWLAMADLFVFPSYREGFPNCVIEAGAMGLPSIVTDINGSREIIKDGENGVIIPSRNARKLEEAMERLYLNRESLKEMAQQARDLIGRRYEQGFVRKCLKNYYRKILEERGVI